MALQQPAVHRVLRLSGVDRAEQLGVVARVEVRSRATRGSRLRIRSQERQREAENERVSEHHEIVTAELSLRVRVWAGKYYERSTQ